MMTLGDFFKAGPNCVPVNAKPVELTCISKAGTLPGGEKNPKGRVVRARAKGAFAFVSAEDVQKSRIAGRRVTRARVLAGLAEDASPEVIDDGDVSLDVTYEILQRALREYDDKERTAGDPLFVDSDLLRELVVPREALRLMRLYDNYVDAEHPEDEPTKANFRGAGGRGEKPVR